MASSQKVGASGNLKDDELYEDLRDAVNDEGPTQIESYCMNCGEQVALAVPLEFGSDCLFL